MRSHRLGSALALCGLLGACRSSEEGEAAADKTAAAGKDAVEPGVSDEPAPAKPTAPGGQLVVDGFATPESVVHDPVADVYLVSNINGAPDAKDENGFISKVSPSGELLEREWITGGLHGPKGMTIADEQLVVLDIDEIRIFDRGSGAAVLSLSASWTFLNDVASDGKGGFVVTDTRAGEGGGVFRVGPSGAGGGLPINHLMSFDRMRPGQAFPDLMVTSIDAEASLGGANGVAMRGEQLILASFAAGELYELELRDDEETGAELATPRVLARPEGPAGQLDGIVVLDDGRLLVSSWTAGAVFAVSPEGEWTTVVGDVETPADIGYDAKRKRLLIPSFRGDQLIIHPL